MPRIILKLFGELLTTLLVGSLLGGGFLLASSQLHLAVPEPHQRVIFFVGILLFSAAFRLLIAIREER